MPAVPVARKRAVIGRIGYVMELGQITRNFLYVLVDHRRIASLCKRLHATSEIAAWLPTASNSDGT